MALIADSNGVVSGVFTIPGPHRVTVGTKLVEFHGSASQAATTFVGSGMVNFMQIREITNELTIRTVQIDEPWRPNPDNVDPLAQTFTLPAATQVAAVDLWFTARGAANVLVQIREVSLGVPTARVLASAVTLPANLSLTEATRFTFAAPVILNANQEYAIVIAGADATTEVATATIGEFDANTQRWVTSQPYQVGVLLSSSNASTWTPHQTQDLTFRILQSRYSSSSRTITLNSVNVVQADHLAVLAAVVRPSPQTDVRFTLGVGANTYIVNEGQTVSLPATYTGTVTLRATLTGTGTISPTLLQDVQVVSGTNQNTGTYISRLFAAAGGAKVSVYYDAILPSGAAVAVAIERGDGGTWSNAPLAASAVLDGDWIEYRHEITDFAHDNLRVRLTLSGSATAAPRVRNLRVAVI